MRAVVVPVKLSPKGGQSVGKKQDLFSFALLVAFHSSDRLHNLEGFALESAALFLNILEAPSTTTGKAA